MKIAIQIEGLKRNNIGDVFQALAAADHLPRIDLILDREALPESADEGKVLLIANGWYMHNYANFPPPPNFTPIYSSVHFSSTEILSRPGARAHFRRYGPVGARDYKTLAMLRAARIPSYYSGCFTAAINRRKKSNSALSPGQLLVVDGIDHPLPDSVVEKIGRVLSMAPIRISHDPLFTDLPFDEYSQKAFDHAEFLLSTYSTAGLVVTTKIHCAIPCLAMGVPVILVHPNPNEERLAPAREFLRVISIDELQTLDASHVPKGRSSKLICRQREIRRFLGQSVICGGNPVARSPEYKWLRIRANILTRLWYHGFNVCMTLGIHRNRLSKIMRQG